MWIVAMFDLPVDSRKARRNYTRFRKQLLSLGFYQLQFSVYGRHCASSDSANRTKGVIESHLPPAGQVRLLTVTERQFGKMQVFEGKKSVDVEGSADQFTLF
jgi:CRISPR-associated protein Cas2